MTLRGAFGLSELFFLTDCLLAKGIKGQSQLIGSSEPIVGLVGHDVILPCRLEPAVNFAEKTVEWTRPDLNPGYVHVFRDGRVLYDQDHPSFKQRANLFLQELKNGNVSLKISQLQLSDKGQYTCHLPSLRSRSVIKLVVGVISEPTISIVNTNGTGIVLQCEAKNWYPEPQMEWRDDEGNVISYDSKEIVSNSNGCYTVRSRVTVQKAASNSYTCTVQQQHINQSRETEKNVPDIFPGQIILMKNSKPFLIGIVAVCGMVLLALVIAAVLCIKYGPTRHLVPVSVDIPMDILDGQKSREDLVRENQHLVETVEKL